MKAINLDLKLAQTPIMLCLIFIELNKSGEIWTRNRLIINTMISCQKIILMLKLLSRVSRYNYIILLH
jgi:hypothetical protein